MCFKKEKAHNFIKEFATCGILHDDVDLCLACHHLPEDANVTLSPKVLESNSL
jgi:hypothetical protein